MRPSSPPHGRRRHARRGSNVIEFALLLPIFLALMALIFDYGWFFFMRSIAQTSVRDGCRTGAVIPPDDDATGEAKSAIQAGMSGFSFFGVDCTSPTDSRCGIAVTTSGASPDETIDCTIEIEYPGMTGIIPMPDTVRAQSSVRFELQR
jgi:Flp pilus assembly protein TadG